MQSDEFNWMDVPSHRQIHVTLKSFIGSEVELVTVSENRAKPDLGITGELGQHSSGRYYVRFDGGKFQFSAISLVAAWEAASGRIVRVRI